MDISYMLEAGLQLNAAVGSVADLADSAINNLPNVAMSSDCCSSNNYEVPG